MNKGLLKRINMGFNYKLAEDIICCFNSDNIHDGLDNLVYLQAIDAEQLIRIIFNEGEECFLKPDKYTLLHRFIEQYLYHYIMNERCAILDGLCDLEADDVLSLFNETVKIINEYGRTVEDFSKEIKAFYVVYEENGDWNKYHDSVARLCDDILNNFDDIEKDVVEAVFYLLYNNKGFLFCFNQYLSKFITKEFLNAEFFDTSNHIKRCKYIPKWIKRAVFYRDNGRCQHCGRDLSGLISINDDKTLQYDHVIPLEKGGTNDATNFQLLCSDCNLKKHGKVIRPKYFYQMYW